MFDVDIYREALMKLRDGEEPSRHEPGMVRDFAMKRIRKFYETAPSTTRIFPIFTASDGRCVGHLTKAYAPAAVGAPVRLMRYEARRYRDASMLVTHVIENAIRYVVEPK